MGTAPPAGYGSGSGTGDGLHGIICGFVLSWAVWPGDAGGHGDLHGLALSTGAEMSEWILVLTIVLYAPGATESQIEQVPVVSEEVCELFADRWENRVNRMLEFAGEREAIALCVKAR